ncbi:hypothetical protein [Nesterenkonia ebinurensis]|nr:hypothetical protein [Nesterenkonia ebinurensis]
MALRSIPRIALRHAPKVLAPKAYAGYYAVSRGARIARRVVGPGRGRR